MSETAFFQSLLGTRKTQKAQLILGIRMLCPHYFIIVLVTAGVMLGGCDVKLTPEQLDAIKRVETAKAAYSRQFQPAMDSMIRCTEVSDPTNCANQFYAKIPSSADYDLALRMCLEKGVSYEYCSGNKRYK